MKGGKVICPDESFDIIIADFVLEHIKISKFFNEINSCLDLEDGFVREVHINII